MCSYMGMRVHVSVLATGHLSVIYKNIAHLFESASLTDLASAGSEDGWP